MRTASGILLAALLGASAPRLAGAQAAPSLPPVWDSVAAVLQTRAVAAAGYVRYNLPRRDLTVRVGDVTLAVPLAGGAWAGFAGTDKASVVMGDLVVTATELPAVEGALVRSGLEITGVHNHLAGEEPRLLYVHFHGEGPAVALAERLDSALVRTATPRPVSAATVPPVTIDTALVFRDLGVRGGAQGSVAQVGFQLVRGKVRWHGRELPPALAFATPINIQAVNPTRAVATGDFALLAGQVEPVVRALAEHGILVAALHTHMVGETPPVYFLHFWADGTPEGVTRGLRAALDAARAVR